MLSLHLAKANTAEVVVDLRPPPVPDGEAPKYIIDVIVSRVMGMRFPIFTVLYPTVVSADIVWKIDTRNLSEGA